MKVVVLAGPESSGKSWLAAQLQQQFGGVLVGEYVRYFIEQNPRALREQRRLLSAFGVAMEEQTHINIDMGARENKAAVLEQNAQPFILAIIDRENSEDAGDLLTELDSRSGNLTIGDVEYLMANTKQATIKTWAADMIRELSE